MFIKHTLSDAQHFANLLARQSMAISEGAQREPERLQQQMREVLDLHKEGHGDGSLPVDANGLVDIAALPPAMELSVLPQAVTEEDLSNLIVGAHDDAYTHLLVSLFTAGRLAEAVGSMPPEQVQQLLYASIRQVRRAQLSHGPRSVRIAG